MTGYLLKGPQNPDEYRIFLSSGDDLGNWRDRAEQLIYLATQQLMQEGISCRLLTDRWEHTAAQRAPNGGVNQLFVDRALASTLTIVLLGSHIWPGTREELEAVINESDSLTQLAVIWFEVDSPPSDTAIEVAEYLKASSAHDRLLYERTGAPNSDKAWFSVSRVIVRSVISATAGTFRAASGVNADDVQPREAE